MPQGRGEDTINVLTPIPSPWVAHSPTLPDGARQELSSFTAAVASEVVGELYYEVDTRSTRATIPRRARQVCFAQVIQRSRPLPWHSESNLGELN